MIIRAIVRTKTFGPIKHVKVAGYQGIEDLTAARNIVLQQVPYARTILFLIPKEEPPCVSPQ
jgi:hypothetical protein